jgi:hypothetical protein
MTAVDLTKVNIPVIAINGSEDAPEEKTVRMKRELKDFTSVVLPGRGHMNATRDPGYAENLVKFLAAHDMK